MERLNLTFKFNVIVMEYPGYGIYAEQSKKVKKSVQILRDAETVFRFVRD